MQGAKKITYIGQKASKNIDVFMIEKLGYPNEVLMELAGQSVASCIYNYIQTPNPKITFLCGSGNNGGDAFVAARHLNRMYPSSNRPEMKVCVFKPVKDNLSHLEKMLNAERIEIINLEETQPDNATEKIAAFENLLQNSDLVIDAIFGYSFKPPLRDPYPLYLTALKGFEDKIMSLDIPSGWDIEEGNTGIGFTPAANISMMLPKEGMKGYKGRHFVGANFMPDIVLEEFGLERPEFDGDSLYFEI